MSRYLILLCMAGCSPIPAAPVATHQPSSVTTVTATPVTSKLESKPSFPPEYFALAEILSMTILTDPKQINNQDNFLHEAHQGLMILQDLKTSDSNIAYIAQLTSASIKDVLQALEKLKTLPQPQSDESAMVESVMTGFMGDVTHGMHLGKQIQQARQEINVEIEKLISACERIDSANQLLIKVAEKYAVPTLDSLEQSPIGIDIDETWWNGHDWCKMSNTGRTLTNCTIIVEMTGMQGAIRKNVHYVKQWLQGSILYCPYRHGDMFNGKTVLKQTVSDIQKVKVTVHSAEGTFQTNYSYTQAEKDCDCRDYFTYLKFNHRYQPFVKGIVYDDLRTMYIQMTGISWLPKCKVTLTFVKGTRSAAWVWEQESWVNEEIKTFEAKDLQFDPDIVKMSIAIEGFQYVHQISFSISP
jgi:hypothetical protein